MCLVLMVVVVDVLVVVLAGDDALGGVFLFVGFLVGDGVWIFRSAAGGVFCLFAFRYVVSLLTNRRTVRRTTHGWRSM